MRLNKLYCSHSEYFKPIIFTEGLNIVLAEVRDPDNTTRSTHDLGKSLLATLIDFCLLKETKNDYFLNKHYERFKDFVFFLEISLENGEFLTIRRPVEKKAEISIISSDGKAFLSKEATWEFTGGIRKAKEDLNSRVSFNVLPKYPYRTFISYFLRDQMSFMDVVKISKYSRQNDVEWKPIVAELLGINPNNIIEKYKFDKNITKINSEIKKASLNNFDSKEQEDIFKAILRIKKESLNEKEKELEELNFKKSDNISIQKLVEELDYDIQKLMNSNYYLGTQIKNAENSLMYNETFDFKEVAQLYKEIGIYFSEHITKDYEDLMNFNREILEERDGILKEIIKENTIIYNSNKENIEQLNDEKSEKLRYISSNDSFEKLHLLEKGIIDYKVEIEQLEQRLKNIKTTHNLEIEKQDIETNISKTVTGLKKDIYKENQILNTIRNHFSDIIVKVLGDAASISVTLNKKNNIDFKTEIFDLKLQSDSSKDKGTTYKKLMCCAFDLALLATYSDKKFIKFVYHDGIFDGLDKRQKENLLKVIKSYIKNYDIQYIFSSIEDELPASLNDRKVIEELKENKSIIKILHDCGEDGRLFNMESF